MLLKRIIPILLLQDGSLIKTKKFNKYSYIGDPCNTVRIFNELEVDELIFLDISAYQQRENPDFQILKEIADECFMPLTYGGGIKSLDHAKTIFDIGFEKISINSASFSNPSLITEISKIFGTQAVIGSIDVKKDLFGSHKVFSKNKNIKINLDLNSWIKMLEDHGVGEILITSVDRDGTWAGYDLELLKKIINKTSVPLIFNGGAGCYDDIRGIFDYSSVNAAGVGSLVVFQKKDMGVLINYPEFNSIKRK